jgi:Smg protein
MFEVLVFMFENYFANHTLPDLNSLSNDEIMEQELSAAGFEQGDILGAFDWFQQMKFMLSASDQAYCHHATSLRVFTEAELNKITTESLGLIIFLQQANVINDMERDLIIDRAMALKQVEVKIEETRWITMMALWNKGREKDYLFVEDALFNPRGLTTQ